MTIQNDILVRGAKAVAPVPGQEPDRDWKPGAALPAERLFSRCDIAGFAFATTDELPELPGLIGQDRAVEAVRFAIGMRRKGFNLFALGPAGTGKHTLVRDLLASRAAADPTPPDWCYVNNFTDPHRPRKLQLPPGRGMPLREAMKRLVSELAAAIPAAFERDDYRARRDVIDQQVKQRSDQAFGELQKKAHAKAVALIRTPMGLALAPMRNGEVVAPDIFAQLPESERERIKTDLEALQAELEAIVHRIPDWEREHREAVRQLNRDTTAIVVAHLLQELRTNFSDLPDVLDYLAEVEHDILENVDEFLASERAPDGEAAGIPVSIRADSGVRRRYQVNVMVDNGALKGAPVIYEDHPTHQSLVGRTEHLARFGALVTDFNLIVPGALHRANGGYLVLDAQRLLTGNFGWESLKRALRQGEIRTVSLEQLLSLASTVSLEPEPIPLDIKVVLTGSPRLYYLLSELDPDFNELFKVAAEFDDRIDRTSAATALYAQLIASVARRERLRPLDRSGVARAIEQVSRASGDGEKLSTHMVGLVDLLQEADYVAAGKGATAIGAADVQSAIDAQTRRADRLYRRAQEQIARNTLRIETEGMQTGQMNGLSVVTLGGYSFGHPSRITAQVRLGKGEVVDIEREVALGGPVHSKGVLILSGFLGGRFGKVAPLSLAASLVFEQSYGGVEGDSASAAELCALLSAIAEVPIRQAFAMTGSIDQLGRIQAIGGVNEKIEGFFDVCRAKGLTGSQGVLIPAANVPHLMLRQDVVEAAAAGQFRVIPVETVDQALELLTGLEAGAADALGQYPEGSINHRITLRLKAFSERTGRYTRPAPPKRGRRSGMVERDD